MVLTLKQGQRFFFFPRTKRGGAASVRSRPPRDAGWRGRWDPELDGSVLGVENTPLPPREAPGVRGSRRRSSSGAPARPLRAGLPAGARTHAGTRSTQSPGRPGRRASFTNPDGDGLRLLLGAPRTIPFSAAARSGGCRSSGLRATLAAEPLASARPQGAHLPRDAPLPLGLELRLRFQAHFPTTGKQPSLASHFRAAHSRKAEVRCFTGAGARKVSVVKVAGATRGYPQLPSGPRPSASSRPEVVVASPPPLAATSWRVAEEVATNPPAG